MNAIVEHLENSIEALIKDRDELQEKIIAMCKAIPDYDWSGDSEKRIANLAKERDGLKAARYAYATEFLLDEECQPDVGSILYNIRALKADHAKVMKAAKLALDALNQSVPGEYDFEECFEAREALRQAGVQ